MTTSSPSSTSSAAPCGCVADLAEQGRHSHVCLVYQTVHIPTEWIGSGHPQDGRPLLLQDLAAANPVWGDERVLPDRAVLRLIVPVPPGVELGLWQRQGPHLVPVTETEYTAAVSACTYGTCDLCDTCLSYRAHAENCIADATDAEHATTAALQAIDNALTRWTTLCANSDAGDGFDLDARDRQYGRRGLDEAAYHLRVTQGVLTAHLVRIRKLDPSLHDLD